jgi:quercetin dioxygenase-like cupin family protein
LDVKLKILNMPQKGQILENPLTGDLYEFIETAKDSNGDRVTIKSTIKSKGILVPNHFHLLQDEVFEVTAGKLTVLLNGELMEITAGEKIFLPKNIPHNHYNNSEQVLEYIHTTTPALDFDYFLENLIGLASDGKMKNGKAGLVQELVTLKYMDSKAFLADIPIGVQKAMMYVIAPIARFFGYRAFYKKYTEIEK